MPEPNYQRLTGRSYGLGGITSLWLGDAHLLQVASALVAEGYRRWYLVEMQALVARRSRKRMAWNVVWGIIGGAALGVSAGFAGLAAGTGQEREAQIALWVLAGLSAAIGGAGALLLLVNSWLGPTCTVFVQTPHGLDPLGAPARERAFNQLVTHLKPHIEAAQRAARAAPAVASPVEAAPGS